MRNNLLSLQQTAKLQDLTQNRLATGLKVNSAIDNPSSYYTAQSLNNRAEDLNILLDAMSQGIQTLKAVNESLETGTKFLEQAKSVASSVLETTQPVAAKVSTEAELLAAIDSGKKGLIVLTSDITMSTNQNIVLNDGQSLVGARYLDKNAAQTRLTFNFTGEEKSGIETVDGSIISDLQINLTTDRRGNQGVIKSQENTRVTLRNLDINMNTDADTVSADRVYFSGIRGGINQLSGTVNINNTGSNSRYTIGITGHKNYQTEVNLSRAELNITSDGELGLGIAYIGKISVSENSQLNILGKGKYNHAVNDVVEIEIKNNSSLNIETLGKTSHGFSLDKDFSNLYVQDTSILNIITRGANSNGILGGDNTFSDRATVNIKASGSGADGIRGGVTTLTDNARLNISTAGTNADSMVEGTLNLKGHAVMNADASLANNSAGFCYQTINVDEFATLNVHGSVGGFFSANTMAPLKLNILSTTSVINNLNGSLFFGANTFMTAVAGSTINNGTKAYTNAAAYDDTGPNWTSAFVAGADITPVTMPDIDAELAKRPVPDTAEDDNRLISSAGQFEQILSQYDQLINDSWYKGVNLLKSQDLKVVFNESRTSDLDIKGVDATTKGLGLETVSWNDAAGVQNALDQIDSAINQLRLYASEFGNYYQIVTTRENFTTSLISVLTEGADQLTLADMNQESANMLALQTRQQLAVNSLSLASQASQSVLKLF